MSDLLSSQEARAVLDRLVSRVLEDERLYRDPAVPEARHALIAGQSCVYWSRPKALADCAALQQVVDEYARLRHLFDPLDERVRAGDNLSALDRSVWERRRQQLLGLEYAVRALAGDLGEAAG